MDKAKATVICTGLISCTALFALFSENDTENKHTLAEITTTCMEAMADQITSSADRIIFESTFSIGAKCYIETVPAPE